MLFSVYVVPRYTYNEITTVDVLYDSTASAAVLAGVAALTHQHKQSAARLRLRLQTGSGSGRLGTDYT